MAVAVRRGFSLDEAHSQSPLRTPPAAIHPRRPTPHLTFDAGERAVRSRKIITYKFYAGEVDAFERPRAPLRSLLSLLFFPLLLFLFIFSRSLPVSSALFSVERNTRIRNDELPS